MIEGTANNPTRINFSNFQNVQLSSFTHIVSTSTEHSLRYIVFYINHPFKQTCYIDNVTIKHI